MFPRPTPRRLTFAARLARVLDGALGAPSAPQWRSHPHRRPASVSWARRPGAPAARSELCTTRAIHERRARTRAVPHAGA